MDNHAILNTDYAKSFAFDHLSQAFPTSSTALIKDELERLQGESIQTAISKISQLIIEKESGSSKLATLLNVFANNNRKLTVYHSTEYCEAALEQLRSDFPSIWTYIIKSMFDDCGQDYVSTFESLELINTNYNWIFKLSNFLNSFRGRSVRNQTSMNEYLRFDMEILSAKKRKKLSEQDKVVAELINHTEYSSHSQLISCTCCFEDLCFEDFIACNEGHLVCLGCIKRLMTEIIYGSNVIPKDGAICCISSVSDGCSAHYPSDLLLRAVGAETFGKFSSLVAKKSLDLSGILYVSCISCPYAEFYDLPSPPLFQSIISFSFLFYEKVKLSFQSISTINYLLILLFATLSQLAFIAVLFMALAKAVQIGASLYSSSLTEKKSLDFSLYRCPKCCKITCLKCSSVVTEPHKCQVDTDEERLRQYVEQAMSMSVIRVCPRCHTRLTKSDGCNKIVCKCGYSLCYVCKSEVSGYDHFCQHFRPVPGNCLKCTKCDLWKSPDENEIVRQAAEGAKERFFEKNPMLKVKYK